MATNTRIDSLFRPYRSTVSPAPRPRATASNSGSANAPANNDSFGADAGAWKGFQKVSTKVLQGVWKGTEKVLTPYTSEKVRPYAVAATVAVIAGVSIGLTHGAGAAVVGAFFLGAFAGSAAKSYKSAIKTFKAWGEEGFFTTGTTSHYRDRHGDGGGGGTATGNPAYGPETYVSRRRY